LEEFYLKIEYNNMFFDLNPLKLQKDDKLSKECEKKAGKENSKFFKRIQIL